jgi:hypothetical protein
MSQILDGIKAIKFSAWEEMYLDAVTNVRKEEVGYIKRFRFYQLVTQNWGRASPVISACSSFLAFTLMGGKLTPDNIFAALSVFLSLRLPVHTVFSWLHLYSDSLAPPPSS